MNKAIELVDYFYSLLTEEHLNNPFQFKKLKSRFKTFKILYKSNPVILEVIDIILNDFFTDSSIAVLDAYTPTVVNTIDENKEINLSVNYTDVEIWDINTLFGFAPTNKTLTKSQLELGYQQNKNIGIESIHAWYRYLSFYHFTSFEQYTPAELQQEYRKMDELKPKISSSTTSFKKRLS